MRHESDSEFIHHEPCPACGSSDALGRYSDGHGHCFSCNHYEHGDGSVDSEAGERPARSRVEGLVDGEVRALPKRGITEETCRKFGYKVGTFSKRTVQIAPYFKDGRPAAQKLRFADKTFTIVGDKKALGLFGQQLWRDGGKKVVITEGEIDCMTVSQLQGNKWPVVSVPNGAQGAKKALQKNLEWLEQFEEVVLMFDQDEPGIAAMQECATLFTPGRCKIAALPGKDANALLMEGKGEQVIAAMWDAKVYRPDGVLNGADMWQAIEKPIEWGLTYPWESITMATYGIRPNEIITLGAGTGMGKTEFFKELATHLLVHHRKNVGLLFLEEAPRDTVLGIMGKHASIPFHIPDSEYTDEQKEQAFKETAGTGRLHLYDHFGYTDYEVVKSRIRYMAVGCNCKHIFLDHVTALVSGSDGDERRELDRIMTDLASLVRELGITLFLISHLATPEGKPHEEGGRVQIKHFRGSRAIGQWSSFMFGLERDQQSEDEVERKTTTFRILKDRYTGRSTGFTTHFQYDAVTGRLQNVDDPFAARDSEFGDETGNDF